MPRKKRSAEATPTAPASKRVKAMSQSANSLSSGNATVQRAPRIKKTVSHKVMSRPSHYSATCQYKLATQHDIDQFKISRVWAPQCGITGFPWTDESYWRSRFFDSMVNCAQAIDMKSQFSKGVFTDEEMEFAAHQVWVRSALILPYYSLLTQIARPR
jgi:hypothetical protein